MSLLEAVNEYPIAGLIVLAVLMLTQRILAIWKGSKNDETIERESYKLAKQTSETINSCKTETCRVMDAITEFMEKDDVGHVSAKLDDAIRLLAKMDDRQSATVAALDRAASLVRYIADDIQKADSRLVHERIIGDIKGVTRTMEDIKRIIIKVAEK